MKNLKKLMFAMVCGFLTVASMSSCIGDSEDDSITADQHRAFGAEMANSYTGKLRMYKAKGENGTSTSVAIYDSITTTWRVTTDSLVSISYFPVEKLDSAIYVGETDQSTSATKYRALQEAIKGCTPETLKCYYIIPSTSYVSSTTIGFFVTPWYIQKSLTYNGETHNVYFVFLGNSTYSYGEFSRTNRTFQFNMMLYGIYEDNVSTSNAIPATYFKNIYISCLAK